MNIFYLDHNPDKAARYHCDRHVVKMILESAQLLSTAHVLCGSPVPPQQMYRPTHNNHPCARWARASLANYRWLHNLATSLCKEYTYRYGRVHKSQQVIERLYLYPNIALPEATLPALAMPEEYKVADPVKAYRAYYKLGKSSLLSYTRRARPSWLGA